MKLEKNRAKARFDAQREEAQRHPRGTPRVRFKRLAVQPAAK